MIKNIRKLKNKFNSIIPFIFSIIISLGIIKVNKDAYNLKILEDQFLANFIGALLALSIAIVTLLYSVIDKVRESMIKSYTTSEKLNNNDMKIKKLLIELKQDTTLIFYILVSIFFISIFANCDIPFISWKITAFSKNSFISFLKIFLMSLTFFSLYDIIGTLFALINIADVLSTKKK